MIIAEIHFSLLGGVAAAVVFALAAATAAWFSYRRTVPPLPPGRRAFLTALRTVTMVALALLLAEPVVQFVDTRTDAPVVAVLVDNTQSIRVSGKDAGGAMAAFLSASAASAPPGAAVRYFPFAGTVTGALDAPPESLSFTGQSTDISGALAGIRKRARRENIQAVVLATDGNYNQGRNPLNELEDLSLPIFTAGAGDTIRQKDLVLDRVFTNAIAYAGSTVPVEAYLRSFGFRNQRVEVTIREGKQVIDSAPVVLDEGKTEYPLRFSVPAGEEGVHKYVVSVAELPGELTAENNSQTFFMRVLKSKIRVVMFAGAPYPDVSALRQAIAEDPQMEVRSFVQKSAGAFIGGAPTAALLDSADCLLFVGFPSSLTSDATTALILSSMQKSKKPLFYVHGKGVDHAKLRSFDEYLPFTLSPPNGAEDPVFAAVPEKMKSNPLVSDEKGEITPESWDRLPPVFKMRTAFRARPGSEVIAFARINTVTLSEPLVLTRNLGGLKSFAVTGHAIYRWRLMSQGSPSTEKFFTSLVSNAVRWLTTRENEKPVRVNPAREIFTTADGVAFRGEVYDDQLRPVDNAEVSVRYSAPGGESFTMALGPLGNGRYEGSNGPVPAGDYSYAATAKDGERVLGTDAGKFSVGPVNVEFLATTMNRQLLEQLAGQSGGEYFPVADGERLWKAVAGKVKLAPREEVTRREIEVWNFGWLGGFLVLLLALEWFLRKRWALL
jgi:hypothetical protein